MHTILGHQTRTDLQGRMRRAVLANQVMYPRHDDVLIGPNVLTLIRPWLQHALLGAFHERRTRCLRGLARLYGVGGGGHGWAERLRERRGRHRVVLVVVVICVALCRVCVLGVDVAVVWSHRDWERRGAELRRVRVGLDERRGRVRQHRVLHVHQRGCGLGFVVSFSF